MAQTLDLPDTLEVLDFVPLCRDKHVAPYPVGIRVISENTRLSQHQVRLATTKLLHDGRLTKMPAYPDYGVVLP
jgi:hypothetical protein